VETIEELEKARVTIPSSIVGVTFFSHYDLWLFQSEKDLKVCDVCDAWDGGLIQGDQLRRIFNQRGSMLMILDEDTIQVSLHKNCRCKLIRIGRHGEEEEES